ncbi:MAG: glycosyltransferase family 4 protein [Bacteroidota bacterium]
MTEKGKIKVIYVISRIDYALAFDWVEKYLDKNKFDLHFVFLNPFTPKLHELFLERGVKSYYVKFNSKSDYPKVAFQILKLFLKIKPSVIHTHLIDACLTAMPVAFLLRIKKRIYTRHHSTYHFDYFPHAVKYDRLINFLSTKIIAISKNVSNVLLNLEKVPAEKVQIVYHGFELDKFVQVDEIIVEKLKLQYVPNNNKPVIGVISRFTEWKGVQFIIPAFKKILQEYPEAYIVLANAHGDMQDEINKQLLDLPSNSYTTIKFEKELYALYKLFDVFVHVPIDEKSEAFGQTYVEALAAGIPSVFTLSGIASEFIVDKKNAIVVDYKNAEMIYSGIKMILNDDHLKESLITNGREDVFKLFGIKEMIKSLEGVYES